MTCPRIILLAACLGLFVLYGVAAPPASPARAGKVLAWSSPEEFDRCYRDRYLDSIAQPGAVTLVRRVLVADEMGAGYDDFQPIRGKTLAKKLLPVADPRVTDAQLIVDGSASACDILINGTPLRAKVLEKSYWNANFERFPVPPQLLKAGMNEIVFRARGNGSGAIRVERSQQPNRSAVSHDGGATWEYDQFGDGGYINGELGVRLNLGRYAPAAWLASPVIDLAATVMHDGMSAGAFAAWQTKSNQPVTMPLDGIPAGLNGRIDALTVDAVAPKGTAVRAFVRTGPTPDGNPERWSAWQPWSPTAKIAWARFAQWRLELATSAAQLAPVVRGVALRVSAVASPEPAGMRSRLARDDNQVIVRSSYPFAYADYHGNARVLRNNWKLADVIAGQDTEFAKLAALRQWVRNQWNDGWDMGSLNYIPSWDARVILSLAPGNRALGMCTHFATTFVQCAQALGTRRAPSSAGTR